MANRWDYLYAKPTVHLSADTWARAMTDGQRRTLDRFAQHVNQRELDDLAREMVTSPTAYRRHVERLANRGGAQLRNTGSVTVVH